MISSMRETSTMRASEQDGSYPRPQLVRHRWADLCGEWEFAYDDEVTGLSDGWHEGTTPLGRRITVPFPPESPASGIGDTSFHPVVWYRRLITPGELDEAGRSEDAPTVMLHFGAVDFRATVWANGRLLGSHEGGQTPFSFELPAEALGDGPLTIVVRAEDDPADVSQPRGKQDWLEQPHVIWYHRTTGIWQPVWLEAVGDDRVTRLNWVPDVTNAQVSLQLRLQGRPRRPLWLDAEIEHDGVELASLRVKLTEPEHRFSLSLPTQGNGQGYEQLLWSPDRPTLLDARLRITDEAGVVVDEVFSYLGLRSIEEAGGRFLLNDRPCYVRSVLEQGYWPESHLAAPSADALRAEVQLIKDLGFNAVRLHEKVEDPRLLFWTDKLGLLVWGEIGSAFEFSPRAIERTVREWMDVLARDAAHPSLVTWVPVNESWGVQHISRDPAQLHYVQALFHLTKALDPSRPVVSNDGWEHAASDLLTIHDYATTGEALGASYADAAAVDALRDGIGPAGRRLVALPGGTNGKPVMVTEFGGISFAPGAPDDTWGYSVATSADDFEGRLRALVSALRMSPVLSGFCYTQLTDTRQEANGLTDEHRVPKLPVATIRDIIAGGSGA
ncbi:beta-galactosidase/beta-glucuronidase [Agromyces ramosus]|uniref:Beta-galactosidase/beta-glucuronidase n=2 Tax=Agromyces ramosus TaxID=33879 RepID=A0ABU0R5S4_9MICO|nr:beta-galactosidase/beta-glucuronidase [Agromyces ramosus]